MDRKRVVYILGMTFYMLAFLALYLLIHAKIGRAETFDEFELVARTQNLIFEETPTRGAKENAKAEKPALAVETEEKVQYEPTLQVPAALMSESAAPDKVERGALYGTGKDLYLHPTGASPEVSPAPIVEGESTPAEAVSQ